MCSDTVRVGAGTCSAVRSACSPNHHASRKRGAKVSAARALPERHGASAPPQRRDWRTHPIQVRQASLKVRQEELGLVPLHLPVLHCGAVELVVQLDGLVPAISAIAPRSARDPGRADGGCDEEGERRTHAAVPYSSWVLSSPIQKCTSQASLSGFTAGSSTYVLSTMYESPLCSLPYLDRGQSTTLNFSIRHTSRPTLTPASTHCGSPSAAAFLHLFSMSEPKSAMFVSCQSGWRSFCMVPSPPPLSRSEIEEHTARDMQGICKGCARHCEGYAARRAGAPGASFTRFDFHSLVIVIINYSLHTAAEHEFRPSQNFGK